MSTDDTNTSDRHEEEPGGRGRRGQGGRGPRGRHGPGSGPRRGGPFGRPGGWQQADLPDASGAAEWFAGRLPDGWYVAPPEIVVDRDEITVVGELAPVDGGEDAAEGRITRWREDTRGQRMAIAEEAQARYGRQVSWGARIGDTGRLFTHLAVPAMTRLRQSERQVLDTLVDAGVARSRSEALAWCVRLVGEHTDSWLADLREAMSEVERLRSAGPDL
jgi:hypothetical protein